jgi:O-antigen/teichoic acid export membrane protein
MKEENGTYYKHFLTLLSGNTIGQIIPFIIAPILSRIFSPEDFSVFANFMAIVSLIGIIATGRLEIAIPLPKDKNKAQDLVFTGLIITVLVSTFSLLIPFFSNQIGAFYHDKQLGNYLWLIPIGVLSYGLLATVNNWVLRNKGYKLISTSKIIQSLINNLLAALLGYLSFGVIGLLIGWIISQYVGIIVLSFSIKTNVTRKRKDFNKTLFKQTLKEFKDFPMVNSLHAFMDVFATQFLLFWIITSVFGSWELGLFAVMFKYIKGPIGVVTYSVSQLFYVEASQSIQDNKPILPLFKRTINIILLFAIPFSIIVLLFAPQLFGWYLGSRWQSAGIYAQYTLPILFFNFIVSPVSGIPILFNKQVKNIVFSFLSYLLSLTALGIAIFLKLSIEHALLTYSIVFSIYYILILFWFTILIKEFESKNGNNFSL